jgi:probable DNA repair protein
LSATEEWLLWREAAAEACEGLDILMPASLADALRRSSALQRDWGLRWPGAPGSESAVLLRAQQAYARRCQERRAYSAADWTHVLRDAGAFASSGVFAGFAAMGTALSARLRQLGAQFWPAAQAELPPAAFQVIACADGSEELQRAAQWCRLQLQQDPAARLLVVVPQLAQRRAAAVRAFEHGLHGGALLGDPGEPLFAVEGGQPLSEYPMISAALALLAMAGAALGFTELAAVLRSPYVGCGTPAQRAALELSLRERNVHEASYARLCALARSQPEARAGAGGAGDGSIAAALEAIAPAVRLPASTREYPPGWARRFAAALDAWGWPGRDPLDSAEQQQRDRFRELLGELALLGEGGAPLGHASAVELLRAMATRSAFEPASGDVPVTLTESIADPLVVYDGIWVAGLDADSWPPPPRPDPFLPIAVQRAAGLPRSSPQGQLDAARLAMTAWQRCARQLVCSWAESDGDVPLQPSRLVAQAARLAPPPSEAGLIGALRASARRESRPADQALAWPAGRRLIGGTRALHLQSMCAFRAVAELRLGALPVAEPVPGLDHLERGRLLHRALQLVWEQLRDSRALRARSAEQQALGALVQSACDSALRERLAARAQPLAPALADNERLRLAGMIVALLRQELRRADAAEFSVVQLEATQDRELGGLPIRVRIDRIDRLEDGRVIVIDYKSGAAQAFRPLDPRPRQPQLLAYALLAAGEVAGVAAVHLNADEIRWRGAAADAALLPALSRSTAPTAPWPELLAHWRRIIDGLVREFAAGLARVDPLPGACATCHLPALCRIEAARQDEPEADAEEANPSVADGGLALAAGATDAR